VFAEVTDTLVQNGRQNLPAVMSLDTTAHQKQSTVLKKVKVKERIAVNGFPSHSYGTSLGIWDHTVLPATRHKRMCPALTPASKLVLDLPTPEGWKAELT